MTAVARGKRRAEPGGASYCSVRPLVYLPKGVTTQRRSARSSRRPESPSRRCITTSAARKDSAQALLTVPLTNLVTELRRIVTTVEHPVQCLEQVIESQYAFCRDDPDRGRFIYALLFGPLGSEIAGELEPFRDSLLSWTEAAVPPAGRSGARPARPGRRLLDRVSRSDRHIHARLPVSRQDTGPRPGPGTRQRLAQRFWRQRKNQGPGIIIMSACDRRSHRDAAGLLMAAASGCGHEATEARPKARPRRGSCRSRWRRLEHRAVERTVEVIGTLRGWEQVTLGSKRSGRVVKVHHDIGDRAQPGEPLVELDPVDARLGVQQAESKYLGELIKLGITKSKPKSSSRSTASARNC